MNQWPRAMDPLIGTVEGLLTIVRREIRLFGKDTAYELHNMRSELWIEQHNGKAVTSQEEAIAVCTMAAACQFINVLFMTGEVCNDTK